MTPTEAQEAIGAKPGYITDTIPGFWAYVLGPYDDSRGGNVLHFWPFENETEESKVISDGRVYTQPQWAAMKFIHRVAACGLTNANRFTPTDDSYHLSRLPKCKRCLAALQKIANPTTPAPMAGDTKGK